jgi:hypothetical protein
MEKEKLENCVRELCTGTPDNPGVGLSVGFEIRKMDLN